LEKKTAAINIRAHHLLCMKYFKGKGYSPEFVSNFYKVIKSLENNPIIRITNGVDIICSACPRSKEKRCVEKDSSFEGEMTEKDNKVIRYLGIELNAGIKIKKARNLVDQNLEKLKEICEGCEWLEYCC